MPGKFESMRAVQKGLDSIPIPAGAGNEKWSRAVKTELCKIGRGFGCYVCAGGVDEAERDHGEWLYDVTWLEYGRNNGPLVNVTLVGECEWAGQTLSSGDSLKYRDAHDDDFEKLLLAPRGCPFDDLPGLERGCFQEDCQTACQENQRVQRLSRRGCLAAGGLGMEPYCGEGGEGLVV